MRIIQAKWDCKTICLTPTDFDFHQQYKDYSTIDLLKIVRQPANYQSIAVAAAQDLLRDREISAEDISGVDQYFLDLENAAKDKKERIETLKNKVADFLEPVRHPSEKVEPNKWVKILLLVMGVQYALILFNTASSLIRFFQCRHCYFDPTIIIMSLTLLYIPVIFYLLFKRKRWGWILLFADSLCTLILGIGQHFFFKYQSIHYGDITSFLVPILIRAAFVSFLWRDSIANHFGIIQETKKRTAIYTIAGSMLFVLIIDLL